MRLIRTKHGFRLSDHGIVISEVRTTPGPTHSVFDVLAVAIAVFAPAVRIGMLGFAGGGMMAPLRQLGVVERIEAVDLDHESYQLFRRHCPQWMPQVDWHGEDAVAWLRRQKPNFDFLLDDLSIPCAGDVVKPDASWEILPRLMRRRLHPDGVAMFNLLPPLPGWRGEVARVAREFRCARVVLLDEFENRILIAGKNVPSARQLGGLLREQLRQLGSRQAEKITVRNGL